MKFQLNKLLNHNFNFENNQLKINPIKLNFSISKTPQSKIIERINDFKVIEKSGNINFYCILNDEGAFNESEAELLKRSVIEYIINSNLNLKYSKESLKFVQNILINNYGADKLSSYIIAHDTIGYGPISVILENSDKIEEIMINGPRSPISIYHSEYGFCETNLKFNGVEEFKFIMNKLIADTEKEVNESFPIIDAELSNGSRIHIQIKPYSQSGATASIRLNSGKSINLRKLIDYKTLTPDIAAYLWLAIELNYNMIISGAPSAGKTTMLTALASFLPRYVRIVSVEEDVNELKFHSNFINSINLQGNSNTEVNLKEQIINALHLRPDRLIIGEIRGAEAHDVFFGSNIGVPFMTTLHSQLDTKSLLYRLRSKPMSIEPNLLKSLDIAIFISHNQIDNSRKIENISEYNWLAKGETLDDLNLPAVKILSVAENGLSQIRGLKKSKVIKKYSEVHALSIEESIAEFKKRSDYLGKLPENHSISEYIQSYWEIK